MLIYGKQPVYYALQRHKDKIKTLYLAKEIDKKEYNAIMRSGVEIKRIPQAAAQKMSKSANHQGFLAEIDEIELREKTFLKNCEFVVVLNSLTDMGNIGSIARTAYALGVDALVICGIKEPQMESIIRTSAGAALDLNIVIYHNIYDILHELKQYNFTIYGAAMGGDDIKSVVCSDKRVLVLGSESDGLNARVLKMLDESVSIPMAHGFDSLNVAVAGAILMERMR